MVTRMSKSIAFILIICTLLFTFLTSCDRKYDENEVIGEAKQLLERSIILNEVYYGRGIDYLSGIKTNGFYCEASPYYLASAGFTTVEELKQMTEEAFSVRYCLNLYDVYFEGVLDDYGNVIYMARYYQKYEDDLPTGKPECIMVYTKHEPIFTSKVEYDYSTVKVTDVKKETLYLTVEATVTSSDGKSQKRTIKFTMIEDVKGWRLDSSTFANYNPKA